MRVVVTGGRDYADRARVFAELNALRPTHIAHGAAGGADTLAHEFARHSRTTVTTYPADWASLGKRAGPLRNRRMLDDFRPDAVLAFPGGRGTADCIRAAVERGIRVIRIE